MKIGILGAGKVGRTLGRKFEDVGYDVLYGTRTEREGTMSLQEVASNSDVLLLTTPFAAAIDLIQSLRDLNDKIVIDVTNPIAKEFDAIERPDGKSGAEHLQDLAPHVRIVKAFNQTGVETLENPNKSMMFIAGDDQEAVRAVQGLASKIGFDAHTLHHLKLARELESLAWLWIHYATKERKHRNFAFYLKENSF
ncbi:NADPH-dependent F420 reductase [Exiguobacterium sp. SH5S13]|uniref:NADPH-dependent F420 reductase n=1 Tax=Exiguobacterium sp. SH5S13 TaxID=2510959 RepID=UPI000352CAA5|nr:NAD(P)-binding domain-containing protein [Exiguobacterium sp. SH5S13]EPE61445.1 NADP oxidoreductase coenzyme F420-dependent family protein [Exiguobacterium sp. S17]